MALTVYATQTQVEQIWSQYGVTVRIDDNADGDVVDSGETATMTAFLGKATTDVNIYLLQRYTVAVCAASTWVSWVTAVFAAVELARRRGEPVPPALQAEYERLLALLEKIAAGLMDLVGDEGLVNPQFDVGATVSNLTVDGRHRRAKIRRIPSTSTTAQQDGTRKQHDAHDSIIW